MAFAPPRVLMHRKVAHLPSLLHPNRHGSLVEVDGVGGDAFAWCGLQDVHGQGLLAHVVAEIQKRAYVIPNGA